MQAISSKTLMDIAAKKLADGEVSAVLGWKKGLFNYDVTPAVFTDEKDLAENFVYTDFCAANLSKYLINETKKPEYRADDRKILVFLKPCDTYSFNQLLTEHRVHRNRVYVVAVPCNGMIDLTGAPYEKCVNCKSKKAVVYDELVGENGEVIDSNRFDEVERIEAMSAEERFAFWQNELSRCIRCNACRNVCPACTCEKCVFDNPASGLENKAISDSFEEKMFHIIRAFHVAGRCTDCGECSRVCPQHIPLHLLNRKLIKDMNEAYGEYQAGAVEGSRAPLVNYSENDIEPAEAVGKGGNNA